MLELLRMQLIRVTYPVAPNPEETARAPWTNSLRR